MKLVKSLLLGSAAAFAAAAGAQAADLPSLKSAPVQYVQICDAYGAGFFYIPGTDVCLKVGGTLTAKFIYGEPGNILSLSQAYKQVPNTVIAPGAATNSAFTQAYEGRASENTLGTEARPYLGLDARDQTAYGTLRTYLYFSLISYASVYDSTSSVNGAAGSPSATSPGYYTGNSTTSPSISDAIVQFAGITAGRAGTMSGFYRGANQIGFNLLESTSTVNMLAYTATFGSGFSATLSLEEAGNHDPGASGLDQNILLGSSGALGVGALVGHQGVTVAEGGETLPDLVANLRVDQAWGSAQIAGAIHQVTTTAIAGTASALVPPIGGTVPGTATPALFVPAQAKATTGYGIVGGVEFNLPELAAGDQLWLEAAYADGALDYAGINPGDDGNLSTGFASGGVTPEENGFQRYDRDAIAVENATGTGYTLEKERAWSALVDVLHHWTPQWYSNFYANFAQVTPGTITQNTDWTEGGLGKAHDWRVGTSLTWSPVAGFYIGVDVTYAKLDQTLAANPGFAPTALPAGIAQNPGDWQAALRVNRAF